MGQVVLLFFRLGVRGELPPLLDSVFSLLSFTRLMMILGLLLSVLSLNRTAEERWDCALLLTDFLSKLERQLQWEYQDCVSSASLMLKGFSSIFSSSIMGESAIQLSSKVILWKQLDCRSYSASCSMMILANLSQGMRSFLLMSQQKTSIECSSFLGSGLWTDSRLARQLYLTRFSSQSMPQSSLNFFMTFLCLKQTSFGFFSLLQRYYNQSFNLTSFWTRLPIQTSTYLMEP